MSPDELKKHEEAMKPLREALAGRMPPPIVREEPKPYEVEEFRCGDSDTTGEPYYVGPAQCDVDTSRLWATMHERDSLRARILALEDLVRDGECVDQRCIWCEADMTSPENTHERDCKAFTMAGLVRNAAPVDTSAATMLEILIEVRQKTVDAESIQRIDEFLSSVAR